jgi:site-specific DNA-cytosine methylase
MRAKGGDYHGGSESLVMWPANVAATLDRSSKSSGSPGGSNQEIFSQHGANLIPQPVPIQDGREIQKAQNGIGVGDQGDPAYTLDTTGAQAVGQPIPFTKSKRAQSVTDDETWVDGQVNPTLSLFDQGDTRATTVAVTQVIPLDLRNSQRDPEKHDAQNRQGLGVGSVGDPAPTVDASFVHGVAHAFYSTGGTHGVNQQPEVSPAVKVGSGLGIPSPPAVAFQQNQLGEVRCGNIAGTVNTNSNASGRNTPMVAHSPAVAFSDISSTLKGGSGERGYPDPSDGNGHSIVRTAMTVRRLTPRECERLQGFPDDYTLILWRKKQAEDCPDGPRYKALGNSMAVNCMAWIGERIAAVDAEIGTKE